MNDVRGAGLGRLRKPAGVAVEDVHAIGFDQRVEHEGRARLPLAILAVTAMHEHRLVREPVFYRTAGAGTGKACHYVLHRGHAAAYTIARAPARERHMAPLRRRLRTARRKRQPQSWPDALKWT